MASYESILEFDERAGSLKRLDFVILNAGVYRTKMHFNASTGHEEDLQTNYLSTVLLVLLFVCIFKDQRNSAQVPISGRVVVVSSDVAGWAKFPQRAADPLLPALDDKTAEWDMAERYGVSKLLTQLFLSELVKTVPSSTVTINTVNPGFCYGSGLARDVNGTVFGAIFFILSHTVGHLSTVGARALVDAAVEKGQESHGHYVEGGKLRP